MKLILENPYRIAGLLVGSTAREQERQIKRLKQLIEAEQEPQGDFSFPVFGDLVRTNDSVIDAASKLNLDGDKMNAALFWFYNGNEITDEPAFEAIKDGDTDTAIEIWRKLVYNSEDESYNEVTKKNASAFHNLSTFYLQEYGIDEDTLQLKLRFLESEFFNELKIKATDGTFKISKKDLQLFFLNSLSQDEGFDSSEFIEAISDIEFSAKEDFWKGFVQKPIEQIEKKIDEAKSKRKTNKPNAVNVGKALFEQTSESLKQLKSILGTTNLKFSSITDKVSDEILQCGIDYFSHYKDSSIDPGSASMDLFRKAKTLAVGNIAKQRCQENTENLQEWIDDKPERDKQGRILEDFKKLKNLIEEFEGRGETVANGKQLLASARPLLNIVKSVSGSTDELYLGLSSRIASNAQGMCVSEINKLQERFSNTNDNAAKAAAILLLKERVNEAWDLITTIGTMDLRQDFRTRFTQNRTSLSNLKTQLAGVNTAGGRSSGGSSGSSGCYIATMAYGDYEHPQVMILRQFRDEILDKSGFGKWFIKTYYLYSPKLVEKLKNKRGINAIIRKSLNQFIKLIK
jgi:hypothetical protein